MTLATPDHSTAPSEAGRTLPDAKVDAKTFVTFDLAGECLGVEVAHVREILDRQSVNQLPNASSDVEGVIDIRGESIPIVNMGTRLGLPRSADSDETRIIVFEIRSEKLTRPIGVFADKVRDVTLIAPECIEKPPSVEEILDNPDLLNGIARHNDLLILLLDVQRVFAGASALPRQLDPAFL
ncbi:MAG: chemotaxis protein CheW [Pseudomonadota bacterium]